MASIGIVQRFELIGYNVNIQFNIYLEPEVGSSDI